jgi:hypothetical protein
VTTAAARSVRARPAIRLLLLVTIVIGLPVWLLPVSTGAQGDGAEPTTPASPDELGTAGPLRLVEQTAWVEPDGELALRLAVDGAPPGSTLELTLHNRLTGRIQFAESVGGGALGPVLDRRCGALLEAGFAALDPCVVPVDAAERDEDGATTVALSVQAEGSGAADRITLPGDGVYPVEITLLGPGGDELDRIVTHLLRVPDAGDDSPPLAVSLIMPFGAPLARQPDGSIVLGEADRARLAERAAVLADHDGVPVVVDAVPETVDALAVTGDTETVDALSAGAAVGEVLGAPLVTLDVGAWWNEGLDAELDDLLGTGRERVTHALGTEVDTTTWRVTPTTDPTTLARLRTRGVSQVVVPEELMPPLDEATFPLALDRPFTVAAADGAQVRAVMDDAALRGHAGSTNDPILDAHHLLADLMVLYSQQPGIPRGVAVSFPSDVDPVFVDTVLAGFVEDVPLRAATVPDLLASADAVREGGSSAREGNPLVRPLLTTPPSDLGSYPARRAQAIEELVPYRTLASTGELATADELIRVSAAGALDDVEQDDYLAGARAQVTDVAGAVRTPEQATVTLTAREGTIPIVVVNQLDRPLDVAVRLESDKLDYPDGETRTVTLQPGENRLEWRVRTRASGAFPVDVVVTSPDGRLDLDSTRFTMRSTAVPGIGIALSALAALFLAVWWARHWHSTRRATRLVTQPPTATGADHERVIDEVMRL